MGNMQEGVLLALLVVVDVMQTSWWYFYSPLSGPEEAGALLPPGPAEEPLYGAQQHPAQPEPLQ